MTTTQDIFNQIQETKKTLEETNIEVNESLTIGDEIDYSSLYEKHPSDAIIIEDDSTNEEEENIIKEIETPIIEEEDTIEELIEEEPPMTQKEYIATYLPQWKQMYGDRLWHSLIDGEDYFWTSLNRKQFNEIEYEMSKLKSSIDMPESEEEQAQIYSSLVNAKNDMMVLEAVLYPTQDVLAKSLECLAGLSYTLSEEILLKSGFHITSTTKL